MPSPLAAHWLLDPAVAYLNHGSYGATPREVLAAQREWQERMEREPVRFMGALEARLDEVRRALGAFVGAEPQDLVFVPNATTAINTMLRSLQLRAGDELLTTDHEYNACLNAAREVAEGVGARLVVAAVPFPARSGDDVVEAILTRVTDRTRAAVVSHVSSATALAWPIERIVGALRERGVETIVDGAHGPGMVPLDLAALGAGSYAGNAHKWSFAPKGSGFLWVRRDLQPRVRPLVISHGANSPRVERGRFRLEFDWTGTTDPTAFLSITAALEFGDRLVPGGWPALMAANRALCLAGRDIVAEALGSPLAAPDELTGSIAALAVPDTTAPVPPRPPAGEADVTLPEDPLGRALFDDDAIEVPVGPWPSTRGRGRPPMRLVRISAQAYNAAEDFERLATSLRHRMAPR